MELNVCQILSHSNGSRQILREACDKEAFS